MRSPPPRPRRLLWAAAASLVALAISTLGVREAHKRRPATGDGQPAFGARLDRDYPSSVGSPWRPAPESPEDVAKEVAATMSAWRTGILDKDADTVVRIRMTFREAPARYAAALVESAKSDANERVRAFSTRELGNLRRADLAELFRHLLEDKSPFVRQNAAWALGELSEADAGRTATRPALAVLKRVRAKDPDDNVRTAARSALDKLE